jgi:hypothetical protein
LPAPGDGVSDIGELGDLDKERLVLFVLDSCESHTPPAS